MFLDTSGIKLVAMFCTCSNLSTFDAATGRLLIECEQLFRIWLAKSSFLLRLLQWTPTMIVLDKISRWLTVAVYWARWTGRRPYTATTRYASRWAAQLWPHAVADLNADRRNDARKKGLVPRKNEQAPDSPVQSISPTHPPIYTSRWTAAKRRRASITPAVRTAALAVGWRTNLLFVNWPAPSP